MRMPSREYANKHARLFVHTGVGMQMRVHLNA